MPDRDTPYRVRTTVALNIRQADGMRFRALSLVQSGDALDVIEDGRLARAKLGRTDQWIQVRTPAGEIGWAAAWLVQALEAGADAFQVTPTVAQLNIRSGDLTNLLLVTTTGAGDSLEVVEDGPIAAYKVALGARPADAGREKQWILVRTAAGATGWAAAWFVTPDPASPAPDPLPELEHEPAGETARRRATGDGTVRPAGETEASPTGEVGADTHPSAADEETRVRDVAFAITRRFEGGSFASFQNNPGDRGVVSFGTFQFTLQSGLLGHLVSQYIAASDRPAAIGLRTFEARLNARDASLRTDIQLKTLLIASADDPIMQQIQIALATDNFWARIHELAIRPRNLALPLTRALLFDIAINFGMGDLFVRKAEGEFGVPSRSRIGANGITEEALIGRVAALRKISHDRQAEREHLPGLKVRGDFWVGLVAAGDWLLHGDVAGDILIKGRKYRVWPVAGQL